MKACFARICLATAPLWMAGCVTNPPIDERATAPTPAPALGSMATVQYLRIDAERTGIVNAADDGLFTYVAFSNGVPSDVTFFDPDGQLITGAMAGRIAALPRLFPAGLLVRVGQGNSFIAPNPRANATDQPPLDTDPEVVEARNRLRIAQTTLPTFKRAIQRADATMREVASREAASGTSSAMGSGAAPYQTPPLPLLKPAAADDPTYQRLPNGVLMRVFFASGGRAIVRPDDGLQRLEQEAKDAHEIRVTGFSDSIGGEAENSAVARMRAETIRDHLLRRGVPDEKIFVSWAGSGRYIADNSTASGRAMNRRVEVSFVKAPAERASSQ